MIERGSYKYTSYIKNVLYLVVESKLLRPLGKHYFLPSLANRMIRMSKDEEMGKKNERNNVPEGSRVKVNLNRTPRIPD